MLGPLDPHRDIETLNEDIESEFMADTDCDTSRISPSLNALDSGNEEYRFTTGIHQFSFCFLLLIGYVRLGTRRITPTEKRSMYKYLILELFYLVHRFFTPSFCKQNNRWRHFQKSLLLLFIV